MKIIVPVDYSDHSETVVRYALDLASRLSAEVTVVHVWETQPKVPPHVKVTTPDGRSATIAELIQEEAEAAMQQFLKGLSVPGGASLPHRILSGAAADAIVKEAEQGGFDLIILGTLGRTGLGRLMIGSVAERVLRTSPVPVLAIPLHKKG